MPRHTLDVGARTGQDPMSQIVPSAASEGIASGEAPARARLWTRAFLLVCVTTLTCYSSQYLLVPILSLYVTATGSSTFVAGLIFTTFSVTSFVLRPVLGRLTDTWSVRGMLMLGSVILGVCGLAFLVPSLWMAFIVNTIRGIGWGATNTSSSTAVALAAPPSRRAEASGSYGVATTLATGVAPALSLWLYSSTGGFTPSFLLAGLVGLAGAAVVAFIPPLGAEAERGRGPFTLRGAGFGLDAFIDRRVLLASFLLLSVTMTSPAVIAFIPMHALGIGVENVGLYFVVNGVTAILSRMVLGRYLDRMTRGVGLASGLSLGIVAFAVLSNASGIGWFIAGGIINSVALTLSQSTLMAIAMDRADPAHMGRAMATYSMFFRAGEGIGAPVAGLLIDWLGYSGMYYGAMVSLALGLLGTAINWQTLNHQVARR